MTKFRFNKKYFYVDQFHLRLKENIGKHEKSGQNDIYIIVFIPVIFVSQCIYTEINQSNALKSLCENVNAINDLTVILAKAEGEKFTIRTQENKSKSGNDWFNREYSRIVKWDKYKGRKASEYVVVFAKPGIGYYACVITHENGLISRMQFEDKSS